MPGISRTRGHPIESRKREGAGLSTDRRARFERLFEDHYDRVLGYALRRADPEEARDVTSEAFLIAWRRFEVIPEDAIPWLIETARNLLRHSQRGGARRRALQHRLEAEPAGLGGDPPMPAGDDAFVEAFARLRERDRESLTLIAWDALDAAEAARSLGISVATFQVRLHRARRRLKVALEAQQHASTTGGER